MSTTEMIADHKELNNYEFVRLSNFIYRNYGIRIPPSKKAMLKARLQSRLRATKMDSFKKYCDYVLSGKNQSEIIHMIDVVSTNKTDFFRERPHFNFLESVILPEFVSVHNDKPLKIWSSACSSGEEVYSIAITISEFAEKSGKPDYSILGTDISSRILERASLAVYAEDRVKPISFHLKKKYLLRSIDKDISQTRIVPALRKKTVFKRLNLMDEKYIGIDTDFDIVFCRNVLIYFDRETQSRVIKKLCRHLKPGGYFMLGHSESVNGMDLPLKQVRPTIYQKTNFDAKYI